MLKRWMPVLLVTAMFLGTGAACGSPPSGWVRPQVATLAVTPAPVVPGEPFTVSVTLLDDHHVASIDVGLNSPKAQEYRQFCQLPTFDPVGDPQTDVQLDITCELPDFATNGTWGLILSVSDGEYDAPYGLGYGSTTFEVVGGSNDDDPPVVESVTIDPAAPLQGQPFTVTAVVSDDHLRVPSGSILGHYSSATSTRTWDCFPDPATQLSPSRQQFVFACGGQSELPAGPSRFRFYVSDLNGNLLDHSVDFTIIDP